MLFFKTFCLAQTFWVTRCCSGGSPSGWIKIYKTCRFLPWEDSLKKITMIALLTEIFNFLNFGKKRKKRNIEVSKNLILET